MTITATPLLLQGALARAARRAAAAYAAEPMLSLTARQAGRLWHLPPSTSVAVLEHLVATGVLVQTPAGTYVRADLPQPIDLALLP